LTGAGAAPAAGTPPKIHWATNHLIAAAPYSGLRRAGPGGKPAAHGVQLQRVRPSIRQDQGWAQFPDMPGLNGGQRYQLADLYGEGLPGVLCRYDQAWYYREPLRCRERRRRTSCYSEWKRLEHMCRVADSQQTLSPVAHRPDRRWQARLGTRHAGGVRLSSPSTQNATGRILCPSMRSPANFCHPMAQIADLVGDGLSDMALIGTRSVRSVCQPSRARVRRRYRRTSSRKKPPTGDDDDLPDAEQHPDSKWWHSPMCIGSGQQHLVRIRHNEVKCWPNLGRGRFGKGFVLSALPFAAHEFNAAQVLAGRPRRLGCGRSDLPGNRRACACS
jgi:hypothetical protein